MQAEIITSGTELLLGEIVDSNAAFIARQLTTIGLNMFRKTTVGDNRARLAEVIKEGLKRSEVIIITGGLGPTVDDVTREAVADATGRELVLDPNLLKQIEEFFARRGRQMSPNNMRQAYIPAGAIPIENPRGTAPSFIVRNPQGMVIALPGVPHEMIYLMENWVIPFLRETLNLKGLIKSKILRTCAIGESNIDSLIGELEKSSNPTVGLSAHPGQTDVRITVKAEDEAQALAMIAEMEAKVRALLEEFIFGVDQETLEGVVARGLVEKGLSLALLETNTGGTLTQRLTGAGVELSFFQGSFVLSSADSASRLLGLPRERLEEWGLVSSQATEAAAERLRELCGSTLGLAMLGTTEVGVGMYEERKGETWLALATPDGEPRVQRLPYGGQSSVDRAWSGNMALDMVRRYILSLRES